MLAQVIDGFQPMPEPLVQLFQRQQRLGIERGQELLAHRAEETLDLAAAFGLIGRRMHEEDADGGGDARQLRRAVDFGVVHIETHGQAARGDGLAKAVEETIQTLVGIELGMRDETAGIVERGLEEYLLFAAAGPFHPGSEQHIGLPNPIGALGFILLVRGGGGFIQQQLAFGESARTQETVNGGGRHRGLLLVAIGERQLVQQGGAGARGIFAFEPFDERGEAVAAVEQRPLQQRVHRDLAAGRVRDVVEARGDLLSAARQLAARERFQHQRGDESVSEQGDFSGFFVHRIPAYGRRWRTTRQMVCGQGSGGGGGGAQCDAATVGNQRRRPAKHVRAEFGEQETVGADPARGGEHGQCALDETRRGRRSGQMSQRGAQTPGLLAEAAQPELAPLVRHRKRFGLAGQGWQQAGEYPQRNHGDARTKIRQGKLVQPRDGAAADFAQIAPRANLAIEIRLDNRARVETVRGERLVGAALRTRLRAWRLEMFQLGEVLLHRTSERV